MRSHGVCIKCSSIVENYVAIIVICTPAVAGFWRQHVGKSALFQSLQSLLVSTKAPSSSDSSNKRSSKPRIYPRAKAYDSESQSDLHPRDYVELSVSGFSLRMVLMEGSNGHALGNQESTTPVGTPTMRHTPSMYPNTRLLFLLIPTSCNMHACPAGHVCGAMPGRTLFLLDAG